MRPEHFEDAAFAPDMERPLKFHQRRRRRGDGVGLYAFFSMHGDAVHSRDLEELDEDAGACARPRPCETVAVARLNAESSARAGTETELVLDTDKITVFALDGENLMRVGS